jgi:hypothetical protein
MAERDQRRYGPGQSGGRSGSPNAPAGSRFTELEALVAAMRGLGGSVISQCLSAAIVKQLARSCAIHNLVPSTSMGHARLIEKGRADGSQSSAGRRPQPQAPPRGPISRQSVLNIYEAILHPLQSHGIDGVDVVLNTLECYLIDGVHKVLDPLQCHGIDGVHEILDTLQSH